MKNIYLAIVGKGDTIIPKNELIIANCAGSEHRRFDIGETKEIQPKKKPETGIVKNKTVSVVNMLPVIDLNFPFI